MFDQLKPLMQNGERYIVIEGGRPEYVLLRFADYAALAGGRAPAGHGGRSAGEWERANTELEEARITPRIEPSFVPDIGSSPDPTTIRLEDLPL